MLGLSQYTRLKFVIVMCKLPMGKKKKKVWHYNVLLDPNKLIQIANKIENQDCALLFNKQFIFECESANLMKLTRSSLTTVSSSSSFPLSQGWKYLNPCGINNMTCVLGAHELLHITSE